MAQAGVKIWIITLSVCTMINQTQGGCSMTKTAAGVVKSPGFPEPYAEGLRCKIRIYAPLGKIIRFNMKSLDLPTPAPNGGCNSDKLSLYDGLNSKAPLLAKLCGNSFSKNYYTTQSEGFIKFTSDSSQTYHKGYKLKVTFIDPPSRSTAPPPTTTTRKATATTAPITSPPATPTPTPKVAWYGGKCGMSMYTDAGDMTAPTPKIINGRNARPHEFPWQAALVYSTGSLRCGAVIISDQWIMTAAHCLVFNLHLVVGAHDIRNPLESNRQEIDLLKKFIHPEYRGATLNYDIALVKLVEPMQLSSAVLPVCPPSVAEGYVHQTAIISGWGYVDKSKTLASVLQYAALNITDHEYCVDQYIEQGTFKKVTDVMFCTDDNRGNTELDACVGDSGGPVVVKLADGRFVLAGLVSWGYKCAEGRPGVSTKVSVLMDWVQSVLDAN